MNAHVATACGWTPKTSFVASGLLLLLPALSLAQTVPPSLIPNPGQIERLFAPEPSPRSRPGPEATPAIGESPATVGEEIRFTLQRVRIIGASIFSEQELRAEYEHLLGHSVGFGDLDAVAHRITFHYRTAGFLLSQAVIPQQEVDGGEISIRVIEGYISNYDIRGDEAGDFPLLATYAQRIADTRPIDAATLERNLLLMNDLPGVAVRATLAPAKDRNGATTLVLDVTRQRFAGGLSLDNRGGNSLGPWRTMLDGQATSLLRPNDRTQLRGVTSGDQKLNYLALVHEQMLGSQGGKIALAASAVRSQPKERFFIPLQQKTESETFTLLYTQPVIRRRAENLSLRTSLGSYQGQTSLFDIVETRDAIRSWRLGATYDLADALGGVNLIDVEYSQGIPGLGASRNGDPMLSRTDGRVDYRKLNLYLARVQMLSGGWSLLGAASAQHAFTDLLASELFSLGGEPFGRGFDPSELIGDHGLAGKLELRYSHSLPEFGIQNAMLYGFQEAGHVRQRTSPPGSNGRESLASSGFGLRLQVANTLSGFIEWAKPRLRDVATENNRNARIFAGIAIRF